MSASASSGNATLRLAARIDRGVERDYQEDNYLVCSDLGKDDWIKNTEDFVPGEWGTMLVVADGMGGLNAGEVASRLAVEGFKAYIREHLRDGLTEEQLLKNAINYANETILKTAMADETTAGMGTTLVAAWLKNYRLHVAWSGDSRCYLWSQSQQSLTQITRDHSYVQELIDARKITVEEAFYHPNKNIITRSLGDVGRDPEPEYNDCPLVPGDRVLLCSDGLNTMLMDHQIEAILASTDTRNAVEVLIDQANAAGGFDNITVLIGEMVDLAAAGAQQVGMETMKPRYSAEQRQPMPAPMPAYTPAPVSDYQQRQYAATPENKNQEKPKTKGGGKWKIWLPIGLLVVVIGVLAVLFSEDIIKSFASGGTKTDSTTIVSPPPNPLPPSNTTTTTVTSNSRSGNGGNNGNGRNGGETPENSNSSIQPPNSASNGIDVFVTTTTLNREFFWQLVDQAIRLSHGTREAADYGNERILTGLVSRKESVTQEEICAELKRLEKKQTAVQGVLDYADKNFNCGINPKSPPSNPQIPAQQPEKTEQEKKNDLRNQKHGWGVCVAIFNDWEKREEKRAEFLEQQPQVDKHTFVYRKKAEIKTPIKKKYGLIIPCSSRVNATALCSQLNKQEKEDYLVVEY